MGGVWGEGEERKKGSVGLGWIRWTELELGLGATYDVMRLSEMTTRSSE